MATSKKSKPLPSQEYLRECFDYDPDTGSLIWRRRPEGHFNTYRAFKIWNARFTGKEVGTPHHAHSRPSKVTYRRVRLNGVAFRVHRLIYKMMYNETPGEIDHINGDGLDNRIDNLRSVDRLGNARNQPLPVNNTSGVIGVHWRRSSDKWRARITVNGQKLELGDFNKFDDAVAARKAAEKKYGYHPNHGRKS
jgi:hypothetical protein